jgi:endonuclease III-like uncharacterized protein
MPPLPLLTSANTVAQMMSKVNDIINYFPNVDAASEIVFVPNGTITANNVQNAIIQVHLQANTAINNVNTALTNVLTANVATLNIRIDQVEENALATAVALAIALG